MSYQDEQAALEAHMMQMEYEAYMNEMAAQEECARQQHIAEISSEIKELELRLSDLYNELERLTK